MAAKTLRSVSSLTRPFITPENVFTKPLRICGNLYQTFKDQTMYRDAPVDGVSVTANYFDNLHLLTSKPKSTLVMLHGAPGSNKDFEPLINQLTQRNHRIIAPDFPGLELSRATKYMYRHSPEEKSEFTKELLKQLNIRNVDMLIAHSSGAFIAANLSTGSFPFKVKSLGLMNPVGYELIPQMKPYILWRALMVLWDAGREDVVVKITQTAMKLKSNPFSVEDLDGAMEGGLAQMNVDREKLRKQFYQIRSSQIPVLYVYSDNDSVMPKSLNHKLIRYLGKHETKADVYDKSGQLVSLESSDGPAELIKFSNGGHFTFKKNAEVVSEAVINFVEKKLKNTQ